MDTKKMLERLGKDLSYWRKERQTVEIWKFLIKREYDNSEILLNSGKRIGIMTKDGNLYFNCSTLEKITFLLNLRTKKAEIWKRIAEIKEIEYEKEVEEKQLKIDELKKKIEELETSKT